MQLSIRNAWLIIVLLCGPAYAADAENGEQLYNSVSVEMTLNGLTFKEANCETCHSAKVYQRDNRIIKTYPSLVAMVERCNTNLDAGWFPDDVEDVAAYLNRAYYHFEP